MILTLVTVLHLAICVVLILIVLLQQGKGADMGAAFGGGSDTLFGASGADNLLTKVTTITAGLFMCTSVYLAFHANQGIDSGGNLFKDAPESVAVEAPAPDTKAVETQQSSAAPAPAAESQAPAQPTQ